MSFDHKKDEGPKENRQQNDPNASFWTEHDQEEEPMMNRAQKRGSIISGMTMPARAKAFGQTMNPTRYPMSSYNAEPGSLQVPPQTRNPPTSTRN
jgi:hypothetical protein